MPETPKKVLLVTPHPDDAEGGCGGTVAKWIGEGAEVVYVLCTNGDKGSSDLEMTSKRLAATRHKEQLEAARVLSVTEVVFLDHPDGGLEDNREFRCEVVRQIRVHRPDVVMCLDPFKGRSHAHRDHRVSGQVTVDAVCTYAWRRLYFPDQIDLEGLKPHLVRQLYLWGSDEPNTFFDISDTIELKVQTLTRHASQFFGSEGPADNIRAHSRRTGERAGLPYAEGFRVVQVALDPLTME